MSAGLGVLVPLVGLALIGCGETFISISSDGRIEVSVTTSGADLDTDGFTISVDGRTEQHVAAGETVVLDGLDEGSHSVLLGGLADTCRVVGSNPRVVVVARDGRAVMAFDVQCVRAAPPQPAQP